ncbi:MAG: hypothetical protein E7L01_18860 [Paenibacillus macerans]|uniref:Putative sWIM zinc finger domain protein n=1 Tax=Paenibacillus macerans TaxID=44252 RepID=A0A090Z915_PAEMA|nr:hypothetical protein [Paenibacillus macerans]KFN07072.1 putative sWIM zinc finger domain protein [Paenibacillus macerans]MBS5910525.1 hypothetical protein [Paenibacillus macerans]MCY7560672.1 hypothetical protein [Paenibacillus macerans]MDU7475370.1 hypothetical protein [Paenibacillus macerans]MEC0151097.1 hypothetical protein [Paenibacillus macerans]
MLAVDIALLLMEEAIEAFGYADDSDGDIGVMAEEALELVGEIAEESRDLDVEQRQRVFEKLMERSDGEIFEGWDEFRIGLLRICAGFADVEALRNKLRMKIEQLISQNAGNEHKDYSNEGMLSIWFEMIQKYGTPEEVEQFAVENLRFSFFREWYIKKFMQKGNFQKVVDLALEGEAQAQDQALRGLVIQWKKLRYEAYKRLSLKEEQKTLAEELLLDGDFGYYEELKQLAGGDTAALYHHLKQELQAKKDWQSKGLYLRLIEAEDDLDELLAYVKEYPGEIERYADRLAKRFEIEVIALYQQRIRLEASAASKRKEYQRVCGIIRRYQKNSRQRPSTPNDRGINGFI